MKRQTKNLLFMMLLFPLGAVCENDLFWKQHTIDNTSRGADGVRLADTNGDGWLDIVTGWEEGGVIRVYQNPGPRNVKKPWFKITVGQVSSPEDAVFADLDEDGFLDVISSCEGNTRQVFVHWAPASWEEYKSSPLWKTESIPAMKDKAQWMFCLPMQIDGKNGIDLVMGAKNKNAYVGWLESPQNPRKMEEWQWHPLIKAGWIMNIKSFDMDSDQDLDLLVSDRRGEKRGCFWLENPGINHIYGNWMRHDISDHTYEFMFFDFSDLNMDGLPDLVCATKSHLLPIYLANPKSPQPWLLQTIQLPQNTGTGKAVRIADINQDSLPDLVISCEGAMDDKRGVYWLENRTNDSNRRWIDHPISSPEGIKFDLLELLDLDQDGDLDVITCEERDNLGVIWYENPMINQETRNSP